MSIKDFPGIEKQVLLAPYTSLKIGGPAEFFYEAKNTDDLIELLRSALTENIAITILGSGSNILISDQGIKGLVIKNMTSGIEFLENKRVKVTSGVPLPFLVSQCAKKGLDVSALSGIPATVGGAVRGNAGNSPAWGGASIGNYLLSASIFDLDSGEIAQVGKNWFQFRPRYSRLKDEPRTVLLNATFQFPYLNPEEITIKVKEWIAKKQAVQPGHQGKLTCGSVFQNPPSDFAGRLIDQECHLKGHQIGNAKICEEHANFFENIGQATATDYLSLIKYVREEVKNKTGVHLDPEIEFLGFSDSELSFLK